MPLTALRVEPDTRFLVLEMGARGRGHLTELTDLVAPDVSIVLNVGTAHLGEFGSREAIAEAKGELVAALRTDGVAVLNADDERVAAMAALAPGRVLTFGTGDDADVRLEDLALDRLGRPAFTLATDGGERGGGAAAGRRPPGDERRRGGRGRARRRSVAGGRGGLAHPGRVALEVADGAPRAAPAASCCSTTPTTPTPSRCGPRSTRSPRSARTPRSGAPSPSWARCASSAPTARRPTASSASTPRAGRPAPRRRRGGPRHPRRRRRGRAPSVFVDDNAAAIAWLREHVRRG